MKNKARTTSWSPSRYRSAEIEQEMCAEPGVVLADVLQRTGGVYKTTTRLTPKFREDIHEIAELTSDDELLRIAELPEVPVSLEHLRDVDPRIRILVGYRLDVTPAESARLRRRLALPPDPRIALHFDEVVFPGTSGRFWSAMRWDTPAGKRAIVRQRRSAKNLAAAACALTCARAGLRLAAHVLPEQRVMPDRDTCPIGEPNPDAHGRLWAGRRSAASASCSGTCAG